MGKDKRLRDKKIQFWVSKNEHEVIKNKAKYCKLSMSTYLRKMSVDGYIINRDFSAISDVNAIGVNINQIAKKVNSQDRALERDYEELFAQYEKMFEVMYDQIING